jgi:hypothetical protein
MKYSDIDEYGRPFKIPEPYKVRHSSLTLSYCLRHLLTLLPFCL